MMSKKRRLEQIASWFAAGDPKWCEKDGEEKWYLLSVRGKKRGELVDSTTIHYDTEEEGWVASCLDEELMLDDKHVVVFDTVDEAKAALMREIPNLIERSFTNMAEITVEDIYEDYGLWADILFPCGKKKAVAWLIEQLWERGHFDV